ncbi:heparinase II/III family protein [Salinarchaeum sp. IM2453]|uniref:alginate lyase family protein n=1 Tax=Salinarchaeum sp. IM2453 TaxID=2862870 RepID=UPI001C83BD7A|nr:alginate lyase family protein [Salinarchaeum sp. IM2453]QZA89072.1 heparinase II/III family protein [Salinarchaeum sp. IM2453]
MTDYLTLVGTALNKQPRQLLGIGRRIVKSNVLPRLPVDIDSRYEKQIPDNFEPEIEPLRSNTEALQASTIERREQYRENARKAADGEITFLNETVTFSNGESVAMDAPQILNQSLHWQLKCWGFEHLEWAWLGYGDKQELSDETIAVHRTWMDEWRENYPIAADTDYLRRYWMPHSVCLRILNWARYDALFHERLDFEFKKQIREFIYKHGAFLSDNVEHGVGGNHLIENAAALVIAGVYADERSWRKQGTRLFERAATEQFFDDGGHFERSPMYHLIVCQRYLTAHSLLSAVDERSKIVQQCASEAVRFLRKLRPPDGCIPLLNDSVFGEALKLDECLRYAEEVGVRGAVNTESSSAGLPDSMPESGFYWLGHDDNRMLVAAHEIAVPHIPAHAHVHPGQFCLWVQGERVLTDTGVYEYAAGDRRQYVRDIASHNTVQVGERNPVRLASSFWLWGQINPVVNVEEQENTLRMTYNVDGIGRPSYSHERTITMSGKTWRVMDELSCNKSVYSRLHIHPAYETARDGNKIIVSGEVPILQIEPQNCEGVRTETTPYYPEFGKYLDRDVIVLERDGSGTINMKIRVVRD